MAGMMLVLRPRTPLASTVATPTLLACCAAVEAAMSPTRTELPAPPSATWLAAVVVAPNPTAVELSKAALAFLPMAVDWTPVATAW